MLIQNPPLEITDRLTMLGTNEYPLFLYRGQREAAIFEGGVGAMGPVVREQLEQLGVDFGSISQIVITHAHPDHVMAVPMLRRLLPNADVLASETAAKTLSIEKAISFFSKIDGLLTEALLKAGSIHQRHRPEPLDRMQIPVTRVVSEADTVRVDGTEFAVLEVPGHSRCSLGFHQPDSGVLIVSDATGYYLPQHQTWWPCYFDGYGDYLSSMRRLADLPAEVLCLSHNAVIQGADDVKAYFAGAIAATEKCHERIVRDATSGKSSREIAEALGAEVYAMSQLMPLDFFQKNCALLVKHSLRHEGIELPESKTALSEKTALRPKN